MLSYTLSFIWNYVWKSQLRRAGNWLAQVFLLLVSILAAWTWHASEGFLLYEEAEFWSWHWWENIYAAYGTAMSNLRLPNWDISYRIFRMEPIATIDKSWAVLGWLSRRHASILRFYNLYMNSWFTLVLRNCICFLCLLCSAFNFINFI